MEKAVLTGAQLLALQEIDDESDHGVGWCDVSEMQKVVLKELESMNTIVVNPVQESARITAKGIEAMGNYVLRGSAEHGQLLLQKTERVPNGKPFESMMRKPNGELPQRPTPKEEPVIPKRHATTCVVEGCNEPRMMSKDGKRTFSRCEKHQRAYWNDRTEKKRSPNAKPAIKALKGEPIAIPVEVVEQSCADECNGCTYREVVSMLRAKYPQIDELVDVMKRAKEIRDELGI